MSYVVISSFENIETGDLQAQGESIAVFADEAAARAHFTGRSGTLDVAARNARLLDADATLIAWTLLLRMADGSMPWGAYDLVDPELAQIDDLPEPGCTHDIDSSADIHFRNGIPPEWPGLLT